MWILWNGVFFKVDDKQATRKFDEIDDPVINWQNVSNGFQKLSELLQKDILPSPLLDLFWI